MRYRRAAGDDRVSVVRYYTGLKLVYSCEGLLKDVKSAGHFKRGLLVPQAFVIGLCLQLLTTSVNHSDSTHSTMHESSAICGHRVCLFRHKHTGSREVICMVEICMWFAWIRVELSILRL